MVTNTKVPIVDLKKEYAFLKKEIACEFEDCLATQHWILGSKVTEFEARVARFLGSRVTVGVASGTDALLLALRALALKTKGKEYFDKKDEIITTSFTFIATAEAIVRAGATPVFVDIEPNTFCISPVAISKAVTKNTVGIVPVHLFGLACAMDDIMSIARAKKLFVVEDVAQAFGATYKKRKAGSIGDLGAFSFFPSKNLGCFGDGGLISTDSAELAELLKILRNHGQTKPYEADHIGYNSRLDALQAGILSVKLRHIEEFNRRRQKCAHYYAQELGDLYQVILPGSFPEYGHVYNLYTIRILKNRDKALAYFNRHGIDARVYYPVLLSEMKAFKHCKAYSLTQARHICDEVVSIPAGPFLTPRQLRMVVEAVNSFFSS
jgi:UDP-2-acetamido-2-deoxy-ribo-hexuluronate aminotransferase